MIRVVIVDDQVIVCEGLRVVLQAHPAIEVVGIAHDGEQALHLIAHIQPDLVLMDLKMPGMNGVHATRELHQRQPNLPVLVLTTFDDDEWVVDAIRAGARGYLLKDARREDLVAAIEGTIAGDTHVDPRVATKLFTFVRNGPPPDAGLAQELTERERQVLRLLASGLTNAAIGARLGLAEGTVRNQVSAILLKLGVADRAQATSLAWRYGLVTPADAEGSR